MAARTKKRRITPEDLLRFRYLSDPQIDPGGERVVFVHRKVGDKNEYVSNLWTVDADGAAPPRPFTSGGRDSRPRWSPDGEHVAFVSGRDKPKSQVYRIPTGGGEAKRLTDFPEGTLGAMRWSPDGKHIAVAFRPQADAWTKDAVKAREEKGLTDPPRVIDHWWYRLDGDGYFDAQRFALYLVDVETGAHRCVYKADTMGFFSFDFSPDGKQMVIGTNRHRRAGLRPWNDEILRLNIASGKLTPITGLPDGPKDAVAWSPDGKHIAYAGRDGTDSTYGTENLELWICNARGGGARSLTGREDYCLMAAPMTDTAEVVFAPNFRWHPDGRKIIAQIGWHGESHLASVPAGRGRITMLTAGAVDHTLGNLSADGKRAALTVSSVTKLAEIGVAHLQAREASVEMRTALNKPLLDTLEVAKPTMHWVKSASGTRVQVWVMRPPGAKGNRRGPAVLEIHGGPHAQYGVGFFHEFQVLAANGYTVVYSNPRGSKGYGRDHCAAIRGDWGVADWEDLQAVIEFMRSRPFVNTKKMGVMGGSYGGYMTNWIIGHTHEFAGAITDRCVSNLVSMGGSSDFMERPDSYFPGNFWDRPEGRWKCSPIRLFGNVKTPTLIIHSEGDLRCNVEQAEQVHAALSLRNIPCRFVRYPRTTSHGLSRGGPPDMRLHRLEQILEWWERYL